MKRRSLTARKIAIVAQAAQVLRAQHPSQRLCELTCGVDALLTQIETDLIAQRLIFESVDIRDLRETMLGVWVANAVPIHTAGALALLVDVCALLNLDDVQSQQALSLADWCDAQGVLDVPLTLEPA